MLTVLFFLHKNKISTKLLSLYSKGILKFLTHEPLVAAMTANCMLHVTGCVCQLCAGDPWVSMCQVPALVSLLPALMMSLTHVTPYWPSRAQVRRSHLPFQALAQLKWGNCDVGVKICWQPLHLVQSWYSPSTQAHSSMFLLTQFLFTD